MDRFAVRVRPDDGMIVVDTAQITRGTPALGQDHLEFEDAAPSKATCSEL